MMTLDMVAAAIVLLRGLFVALNAMCPKTRMSIRLTWITADGRRCGRAVAGWCTWLA